MLRADAPVARDKFPLHGTGNGKCGNKLLLNCQTANLVRLEPIELVNINSTLDWDNNFIKTKIILKGGAFSGQYIADIMTIDFEKFKQELGPLYDNLGGSATFADLEHALELKIKGDGIGHFEVNAKAFDKPNIDRSVLTFTMSFDQTELKSIMNQLDRITKKFPIVGNFKIKNKERLH